MADSVYLEVDRIETILTNLRIQFEAAWSTDTAHHSVINQKGNAPLSTGQCFVTSWLAKRYFQKKFSIDNIIVCRGTLTCNGSKIIDDHCWIESNVYERRYIIDITQDQATTNRIYAKFKDDCEKDGFMYTSMLVYDKDACIKTEALKRVALLEKRLGWNTNA